MNVARTGGFKSPLRQVQARSACRQPFLAHVAGRLFPRVAPQVACCSRLFRACARASAHLLLNQLGDKTSEPGLRDVRGPGRGARM